MNHSRSRVGRFALRSLGVLSMTTAFALAPAAAAAKAVILPWIAQTRGALAQSSDLHVLNPGKAPLAVRLTLVAPGGGDPIPCGARVVEPQAAWSTVDARRRLCGNADAAGVLVASFDDGAEGPVIASIDTVVAVDGNRFARTSPTSHEGDAALPGQAQHLVGLRQNANSRTALWLFNPSTDPGEYDVIYRALDGAELGVIPAVRIGSGKLRQLSPNQHPAPATAASTGGFTVEIVVRSGALISFGIVVDDTVAAPTITAGETR